MISYSTILNVSWEYFSELGLTVISITIEHRLTKQQRRVVVICHYMMKEEVSHSAFVQPVCLSIITTG